MTSDVKGTLRRVVIKALEEFAAAAERQTGRKDLTAPLGAFQVSPRFAHLLEEGFAALRECIETEGLKAERTSPFQRLLSSPLAEAFESKALSRVHLANYFSFIHLVLGDQVTALATRAEALAEDLKDEGRAFDWNRFYADPDAETLLWIVLVKIAEAFRRFDARRDWFIGVMQYTPQAVSVGPNAFIPKSQAEAEPGEDTSFGVAQFNTMFGCLFGPMRHLGSNARQRFEKDFGQTPEKVFGALWDHLEASGAVL